MLKRNVKILKYIKSHPNVTCETIQNKFNLPDIDTVDLLLHRYIQITETIPNHDSEGYETGEKVIAENSKIVCNDIGEEFIEVVSASQKSITISTTIAVLGLIKSFDSELILLAEQIWNIAEKLLK